MEEIGPSRFPGVPEVSSADDEQDICRPEFPVVSPEDASPSSELACSIDPPKDNNDDNENNENILSTMETMETHATEIGEQASCLAGAEIIEAIACPDETRAEEHSSKNVTFDLPDESEVNEASIEDASQVSLSIEETTTENNARVEEGNAGQVNSSGEHRLWHRSSEFFTQACGTCNWIPKMCSCIESRPSVSTNSRYQRLSSVPTLFQYSSLMHDANNAETLDSERHAELTFYFDDNSCKTLIVEKNLRIIDLCELLKVNRNCTGTAWSIVETWPVLGISRTLEDHEDILAAHREMEKFASHHDRKFYFLLDFTKYEVFVNPKQFFPRDMVAFPNDEDRGPIGDPEDALRRYLYRENIECPEVCSLIWIRNEGSNSWKKMYMFLQGRKLYTTRKGSFPNSKFPKGYPQVPSARERSINQRTPSPEPMPSTSTATNVSYYPSQFGRFHHPNTGTTPKRNQDNEQPSTLAHLSDYYIYKISNAKKYFNAPYEWAVCLRPSSDAEAEDTEAGVRGIKVIAFTSEKARNCWLTAMRLAKYGKQLRENYRAFKNKQCDQNGGGSTKDQYTSTNVTNESLRSRVAMDFTGSSGRIVEDPKEAKDIAESEGISWRRRWRPFSRQRPGASTLVGLHGLDRGIHVLQPWFHSNLNREVAAAIIKEHGTVDGVFLVRESKSNPGSYVLTYKYNEKVFHCQIQAMYDERGDCWLFTLDRGVTKFYDLLQMIEFHQLNSGSLPTKLTHYVTSGVTVNQRPEESGTSPSPPSSSNRGSMSPRSPKSSSSM